MRFADCSRFTTSLKIAQTDILSLTTSPRILRIGMPKCRSFRPQPKWEQMTSEARNKLVVT